MKYDLYQCFLKVCTISLKLCYRYQFILTYFVLLFVFFYVVMIGINLSTFLQHRRSFWHESGQNGTKPTFDIDIVCRKCTITIYLDNTLDMNCVTI